MYFFVLEWQPTVELKTVHSSSLPPWDPICTVALDACRGNPRNPNEEAVVLFPTIRILQVLYQMLYNLHHMHGMVELSLFLHYEIQ